MGRSHKFFFSLSFVIFLALATFIAYSAIQGRKTTGSKAELTLTKNSIAYVGCSNTWQAIEGYHAFAANKDLFWPIDATNYDIGGLTVERWAGGGNWDGFDKMKQLHGNPKAVWLQLCVLEQESKNTTTTVNTVTAVINKIKEHTSPTTPIYISPINSYVPPDFCSKVGRDGDAYIKDLRNEAVSRDLALRGPEIGPIQPEQKVDGCHPNAAGRLVLGADLAEFFDKFAGTGGAICSPPNCGGGRVLVCNRSDGCPGGCGLVCAVPTATPPPGSCDRPECPPGRVAICTQPNGCPGGCGLTCAVPTATPTQGQAQCTTGVTPRILTPGTTVTRGEHLIDWRCVQDADGYYITVNKAPFAGQDDSTSLTCGQNGDVCRALEGKFTTKLTYNFSDPTVKYRVLIYSKKNAVRRTPPANLVVSVGGGTTITPPPPVCTPPVCPSGKVLKCGNPAGCPGGCGTICADPTPTKTPTPTPTTNPGGGPTDTPVPGATVDLKLNVRLSFQGINSQRDKELSVLLTLVHPTKRYQKEVTVTSNQNGVWEGTAQIQDVLKKDNYYLLVKGPKHVQKRICRLVPTETKPGTFSCFDGNISVDSNEITVNAAGITLLTGDLPEQDGVVDSYDVSLVRNILTKPLEQRKNAENTRLADINLDGVVDTQDYSLVIAALSIRSDER